MVEKQSGPGVLSQLPDDLKYLIPPALKYGVYQFDQDIDDFLNSATPAQMYELNILAARVLHEGAYPRVLIWLKTFPFPEHQASAALYFMFGVMDAADIRFD